MSIAQLAQAVRSGSVDPKRPVQSPEPSKKNSLAAPESQIGQAAPTGVQQTAELFELNSQSLPAMWARILAQLGQFQRNDFECAGFPAISGPNTVELKFPQGYNGARERCQEPEKVARIEQLLLELTGQKWRLRISSSNAANQGGTTDIGQRDLGNSRVNQSPANVETPEPPLVQWAKELLNAKPIRVDTGFGATSPSRATSNPADTEEP